MLGDGQQHKVGQAREVARRCSTDSAGEASEPGGSNQRVKKETIDLLGAK
jgi:hypothetical protein